MGEHAHSSSELGDIQTYRGWKQQPGTSTDHRESGVSQTSTQETTMMTDKRPQHQTWNRYQKLDFLLDTCSAEFKESLLDKIVCSMSEDEFSETYEYITRTEGIARDYDELDQITRENSIFEPQLD